MSEKSLNMQTYKQLKIKFLWVLNKFDYFNV